MATADSAASPILHSSKIPCRPFLKWVGGKSQLLAELSSRVPQFSGSYFEPFVGGGALFFSLQRSNAHLSDTNKELINCYQVVRDQVEALIDALKQHRYEADYYYAVRNIDKSPEFLLWTPLMRAARLIFLNKTCFNGLYRVNSKGQFNVPLGRYSNPKIVDADNLRACSQVLQGCTMSEQSFEVALAPAVSGDFVYLDPPYVPLSNTSYFTSYSSEGFGLQQQQQLLQVCQDLTRRGVNFLLSNSSAPWVLENYKKFRVELIAANRSINSKANKRGAVNEALVRNY